ncbi:hypothetical protein A9K55_008324 [Cordyceps militaris]|uniref:Uncharacterized protein n=1 Tax=Cordyceps militaris TaxID=73501 RepID=A0A2H4SKK0_CORMI|nr:hypothetical protein A9K55_008324 [Cordyceps militaris]
MYALVVFLVEQPAPSPGGSRQGRLGRGPALSRSGCLRNHRTRKKTGDNDGTGKTGGIAGAPNMQRYAEKTVEESRRAITPRAFGPSLLAGLVRPYDWVQGARTLQVCTTLRQGFHSAGWPILSAQQTIGGPGGPRTVGPDRPLTSPVQKPPRPHNGIIVGVEQDDRTLTISCSRVTNGETSASARPMWLGKFGDPWTLGRTGTLRLRSVGTCSKSFCKGAIACPSSGSCPMYIRRRLYVTQEGWGVGVQVILWREAGMAMPVLDRMGASAGMYLHQYCIYSIQ